ncbi:MAG: NADH-quinone oxidoreductase subunit C [Candidatus Kapaibacterium sp.]
MTAQEIFEKLNQEVPDAKAELVEEENYEPYINIAAEKVDDVCFLMRDDDDLNFDYLMCLSGMDYGDDLGVVYHLYSIAKKHKIVLKTTVKRDDPKLPTVETIWKAADWHEREAYDMFGLIFEGHHNLIRILCPYDWEGYPLRKDYKEPEEYHGIKVPY